MKRNYFIKYLLIAGAAAFIYSCDKVNDPVKETHVVPPIDTSVTAVKKILIEDYTGHTCGNCPRAARELDTICDTYGKQIVRLAVHAGFYAWPTGGCLTDDFRTPAGNDLNTFFGNEAAGNPNGLVNRIDYPSGHHIKQWGDWNGIAATLLAIAPDAQIKITNVYSSSTNTVDITLESKFVNALAGDYKLSVFIAEDSIVSCQDDYDYVPNNHVVTNYVNRNILRGAINNTWGELLISNPAVNTPYTKNYSYALSATWNASKCHIIAFIYDVATYEIIQAEDQKVIQ